MRNNLHTTQEILLDEVRKNVKELEGTLNSILSVLNYISNNTDIEVNLMTTLVNRVFRNCITQTINVSPSSTGLLIGASTKKRYITIKGIIGGGQLLVSTISGAPVANSFVLTNNQYLSLRCSEALYYRNTGGGSGLISIISCEETI